MKNLADMIWIELRKALRSRMLFYTTLVSLFMPLAIAFMIFIARNPELSRKLGLVSAKANLMAYSATNWPTYLGLQAQMISAAGFFFFCLVISWVFGREFTDGTLKDMLAVPVQRSSILLAKFIVTALWSAALTAIIFIVALLMGAIIGLPQASASVFLHGAGFVAITACLVIVIVLPFAFFASVGRGYLLPIGITILLMIMANLLQLAGWGEYFPWAVAGLYAQGKDYLVPASYWIAIFTGAVGMLATYVWWKYSDQSR
jgi:ABC-2 type transport system permease protein